MSAMKNWPVADHANSPWVMDLEEFFDDFAEVMWFILALDLHLFLKLLKYWSKRYSLLGGL